MRTSNYLKIIERFDLIHMMSEADLVISGVEILMIDSERFLEKEYTELICMNP